MNNNSLLKQSIKQICNGLECYEEASEQVIIPVGNKVIVLEVCKKCLPNFKEDKQIE